MIIGEIYNKHPDVISCRYTIFQWIGMSQGKVTDQLDHSVQCNITSQDFVYYFPVRKTKKIIKISPTKVGKRPTYKFFIDYNYKYYPLWCMLDLGNTCSVIPPEAAKAFKIPVVRITKKIQRKDGSEQAIVMENHDRIPLGMVFPNYRSDNEEDHAFHVIKTSSD
jgi:hypothetical protein